nr:hypothetical protein [Escherichia coli]
MELDAILDNLSDEEQIELLELLEEEENYRHTHLLYEFTPYSKQREFIDAGHDYPERCFMAGNQLGKSFTGAAEVAFHLTGRYPGTKGYPADGKYGGEWKGKRFYEPVVFWIGGETNETVTKTTQRILCGRIEENDEPGYGSIPKEDIISWKKSPFFPNLVDHLLVKHHTADGVEDGISICYFKPYSQGRARWQGDTIHGVWFDEEPPYSIYGEGLTRTNKYGQFSILTFTPLMGMSDVVTKFLKNPSKSQKVVNMTIYDAEHYTDEQKEQIIASYPEHEREARARGIPTMGSGRIFQISSTTGFKRGDKISFTGVKFLSQMAKNVLTDDATFSITRVIDGTHIEITPKPIALDDASLTKEEKAYANVNTSLADTTPVNVLNVATTTANVFWADDSIRLLSQPIPVTHELFAGMKTSSFSIPGIGVNGIFATQGDINTLSGKCRNAQCC